LSSEELQKTDACVKTGKNRVFNTERHAAGQVLMEPLNKCYLETVIKTESSLGLQGCGQVHLACFFPGSHLLVIQAFS